VLGGGCEIMLHCHGVVAAFESYIGLVETGVGLIPAGGGCKWLAQRAAQTADDLFVALRPYVETVAMAKVSSSAEHARQLGFLREADTIVMHPALLLHTACAKVKSLAAGGFRPALPTSIPVAGRGVLAMFKAHLLNLQRGGMISTHDLRVATYLVTALCGGEIEDNTSVNVEWFWRLEREGFMALLQTPETLARIQHTLKTGKPLRN
jgi:3-hydroxyacyl-CoA dehydrogenase